MKCIVLCGDFRSFCSIYSTLFASKTQDIYGDFCGLFGGSVLESEMGELMGMGAKYAGLSASGNETEKLIYE